MYRDRSESVAPNGRGVSGRRAFRPRRSDGMAAEAALPAIRRCHGVVFAFRLVLLLKPPAFVCDFF